MPKQTDTLVGVTEIAQRLNRSRQWVDITRRRGLLPEPVAELAGGRVWRWEDVEKVARERGWLREEDAHRDTE